MDLEIIRKIGSTKKSGIWHASLNGKEVILKYTKYIDQEYKILKRINCEHPNLLCLIDRIKYNQKDYLVYDYVGTLPELSEFANIMLLSPKQIVKVFRDLADACRFLHSKGIFHLDIKPENILIKEDHIYLIDYDLSCLDDECERVKTPIGTPKYMAPESWRGKSVSPYFDIYSIGMTYYYILNNRTAYPDINNVKEYGRSVLYNDPKIPTNELELSQYLFLNLAELSLRMISKDPDSRPSLDQVVNLLDSLDDEFFSR